MMRLAAVIFTAAFLASASANAQRGTFPAVPAQREPAPRAAQAYEPPAPREYTIPNSDVFTEPAGTFSFTKPRAWKDFDTASLPGSPRLEMVMSDRTGECWFVRNENERTAKMSAAELIAARKQPVSAEVWTRLASTQQLLLGSPQIAVVTSEVVTVRGWPVQTATLQGRGYPVYAALHGRPGLYVWAFCQSHDGEDRSQILRAIAASVTTPQDNAWLAQLR